MLRPQIPVQQPSEQAQAVKRAEPEMAKTAAKTIARPVLVPDNTIVKTLQSPAAIPAPTPAPAAPSHNEPAAETQVSAAQETAVQKTESKVIDRKQEAVSLPDRGTGAGEGAVEPGVVQTAYPRYQLNGPPPYPGLARKRGWQGTVFLRVLVNRKGRVDDLTIDVSSGYSLLDRAALNAVRGWIFEPGRQGRDTVPMWVRVPVTFMLK